MPKTPTAVCSPFLLPLPAVFTGAQKEGKKRIEPHSKHWWTLRGGHPQRAGEAVGRTEDPSDLQSPVPACCLHLLHLLKAFCYHKFLREKKSYLKKERKKKSGKTDFLSELTHNKLCNISVF